MVAKALSESDPKPGLKLSSGMASACSDCHLLFRMVVVNEAEVKLVTYVIYQ